LKTQKESVKQSLLEEIRSSTSITGRIPILLQIINKLDTQDKADLLAALNDYTISAPAISRALENRGHRISVGSINQYRRGELRHVTG
jgi:hypothetical protein